MRGSGWCLAALLLIGCGGRIDPPALEGSGGLGNDLLAATVVEQSQPMTPIWVRGEESPRADVIGFVGSAEASSRIAAKESARRELMAAISSFISVEVESEESDRASYSVKDGVAHSEQEISSRVRTRSATQLREVASDGFYWEKIVASPLTPQRLSYRYAVHASLARPQIARLRLADQNARQEQTGRHVVALLPFVALGTAPSDVLRNGLVEEIGRRLAGDPRFHLAEPALVRSVLPAGVADLSSPQVLSQVGDALLPDTILRGTYQRHGDRLKVSVVLHDGTSGTPFVAFAQQRPYRELLRLADDLVGRFRRELGQRVSSSTDTPATVALAAEPAPAGAAAAPSLEAFEAYHRAYDLFARGSYGPALEAITRSIELQRSEPRGYLRLGRILERMGRYGRIPPSPAVTGQSPREIMVCSETGQAAARRAKAFLDERARELDTGTAARAPWWQGSEALEVDEVLAMAELELAILAHGALEPQQLDHELTIDTFVPPSAAEAYWLALVLAAKQGDLRGAMENALALGNLAVRVDRLEQAERILADVTRYAVRVNDPHLRSLGLFGLGVVFRKQGRHQEARLKLRGALVYRANLGEKPLLLEIYNELGGLAVEMGELRAAERHFKKAWRIAGQLNNRYLEAVLDNNIGVLEYSRGEINSANERFNRAKDFLFNLGESEGQIASGLNLGYVTNLLGDPEGAALIFAAVDDIVTKTAQEGQLAQLHAQRASLELGRGDDEDALYSLATALLLYRGLGRAVQQQRLQSSLLAADYRLAEEESVRACIKQSYWRLGAPVFDPAPGQRRMQTVEQIDTRSLQPQDLVTALNAATVVAFSQWVAPHVQQSGGSPPVSAPQDPQRLLHPSSLRRARQLPPDQQRSLARLILESLAAMARDTGRLERLRGNDCLLAFVTHLRHAGYHGSRFFRAVARGEGQPAGEWLTGMVVVFQSAPNVRPGMFGCGGAAALEPPPTLEPPPPPPDYRPDRPPDFELLLPEEAPPPPRRSRRGGGEDLRPPQIVHQPCDGYERGRAYTVVAQFYDESSILNPTLFYRTSKTHRWVNAPFVHWYDNVYRAVVPAQHLIRRLEYFIEVFDEDGNGPSRYGSQTAPVRLEPLPYAADCDQIPDDLEDYEPTIDEPESGGGGGERDVPTMAVPSAEPDYDEPVLVSEGAATDGAREKRPLFDVEAPPPEEPAAAEEPALEFEKAAEYEKILGATILEPDVTILLTPNQCRRSWLLSPADPGRSTRPPTPPRIRPNSFHGHYRLKMRWLANNDSTKLRPFFTDRPVSMFDEVEEIPQLTPVERAVEMLEAIVVHFETLGMRRHAAVASVNAGALAWLSGDADRAYAQIMRARVTFAELGDVGGIAVTYEWLGFLFAKSHEGDLAAQHLGLAHSLYAMLGDEAAAERLVRYVKR